MTSRSFKSSCRAVAGSTRRRTADTRGFALVVTLSLLVLLTVTAVGFLSLSAVSLRSSSQGQAQMQARTNARLALQFAIAELQRNAGPDMRVTASADILDDADASSPSNLAVTGVWKSWEGSDHAPTGTAAARPVAPDYDSKRQAASSANGRFLSWLVSKPSNLSEADLISDASAWSVSTALQDIVRNTPFDGSVPLVSTGSLAADDAREVHVVPVPIHGGGSQRGSYAWWVSGENQKARLPVPYKPANNDDATAWSLQAKSHATADPSALHLDAVLAADGPANAAKVLSLGSSSLLAPNDPNLPNPARQFHDLSAVSVGLLTNTATGGWRKDLSLLTENWDLLPDSGAEIFRITPSTPATMTKPTVENPTPLDSIFYPWSDYRVENADLSNVRDAYDATGAAASWHHLKEYVTHYKKISMPPGGGTPGITQYNTFLESAAFTQSPGEQKSYKFDYHHKVQIVPIVAQTRWLFMHRSKKADGNNYQVQFKAAPVITLWNPYNMAMVTKKATLIYPRNMPIALRFWVGSKKSFWYYKAGESGFEPPDMEGWKPFGGEEQFIVPSITLMPGETKVLMADGRPPDTSSPAGDWWDQGTEKTVDNADDPGKPLLAGKDEQVQVEARFDARYQEDKIEAVGVATRFIDDSYVGNSSNKPTWSSYQTAYERSVAGALWPPIAKENLLAVNPLQVTKNSKPFLSMIFGPRISLGADIGGIPSHRHIPSKGVLQSTPFAPSLPMGLFGRAGIYGDYDGTVHPVNSPYDVSYLPHAAIDDYLPNVESGTSRGYICSGITAAKGLSRLVLAELPLRPLCSLAELQHWDACFGKLVPPYQLNIVANSDAQPLLPPDNVVNTPAVDAPNLNLQHDDSYCANHLLFDDWFFSTIAPQPTTFGPTGKTLQETFTALVRDAAPLDNRAYRSILEDRSVTAAQATDLFNTKVNAADSYRSIASRLEVDGMFNVNSTSVKAWRALLGHARNQRVPYGDNNGEMVLSASTNYAMSRTTVASDVAAGASNGTSGKFAEASEYAGYRVFTDEMLDQMAEEMVRQVRKRGPFLSLSEFVNRQLSNNPSDNSLALAGAVQSALNVLAAKSNAALNPYSVLQANSSNAGENKDKDADYNHPEASEGKSLYGLPGWPRQADILRPLAPTLSARDDTFTIRAYGDARDANGKVTARATCEAVVRRERQFVSPGQDAPDIIGLPTAAANQQYGRRFQLVSFRWLHASEI